MATMPMQQQRTELHRTETTTRHIFNGAAVKARMAAVGYTLNALSRDTGIDASNVSRYLYGVPMCEPTFRRFEQALAARGIDL